MADIAPISLAALAPWGASMPDPQRIMTADELLHDTANEKGYELVQGRLIKMSPTGRIHGLISMRCGAALLAYADAHQLGEVYGAETGFLLSRNPDTVLAPDVAFVQASRVPTGPTAEGFLPLAPDLAVEVASPDQYRPEMARKAGDWLAAGARMVWIFWPKRKEVDVWQPGQAMVTLHADDMLDGGAVLPGFQHPVGGFFV
jgi:Uma2 family endonuclease